MRRTMTVGLTALVSVLLLAGCGESTDPANDTMTASDLAKTAQSQAGEAFNEADVTFVQGMIPHHRQAIEMAELATEAAQSDEVRQLAGDIKAAQDPEIQAMIGWLESWGEDVPEDMAGMEGMDHGGSAMDDMPGMMSAEEMAALTDASGVEFDRMFLTMMIAHHEGAIETAQTEQSDGESPEALELAASIVAAQQAEIAQMQALLATL